MAKNNILQLVNISKYYTRSHWILKDLNLTIYENEIVAIAGSSGTGKTTLLRIIAGLENSNGGSVHICGQQMTAPTVFVAPEHRNVGVIFQEHALFPHLTVQQNIAFGLHGLSPQMRRARVDEMVSLLKIDRLQKRYPHQISGGQIQRVSIARALAPRPRLLLLDEPFNNLDLSLREAILPDLHSVLKTQNISALCITHLPQEAFAIADRIAVLHDAHIAQCCNPQKLYRQPVNKQIARFFGIINCISARYRAQEGIVEVAPKTFFIPSNDVLNAYTVDTQLEILLRPDEIELFLDLSSQECKRPDILLLRGSVLSVKFYGHYQTISINLVEKIFTHPILIHTAPELTVKVNQTVSIGIYTRSIHIVAAQHGTH